MRRKLTAELHQWRSKSDRQPLLLFGARQVGKTYTLREFGKTYPHMVYFNFETTPGLSQLFDGDIDPRRIVHLLEVQARDRIIPGQTLIILDEIQACERAVTSLKYFSEGAPEFHIVAAGSLLGVAVNRQEYSFPVGTVDSRYLHPLDFEEFLWAAGEEGLAGEIRTCFAHHEALPVALHHRALDHYRNYLVTGGMPAVLNVYFTEQSLIHVPEVQSQILRGYVADMAKYTTAGEAVRVRAAFESIPAQLAKENRKFQYKIAQKGGTASSFGAAVAWLTYSGTVLKCQRVAHAVTPLAAHGDAAAFKLYLSDVGLLASLSGLPQAMLLAADTMDNTFLGSVVENYVAQALAANGVPLHYWTSPGKAEVDFVKQDQAQVRGLEVKKGSRTQSKSLGVMMTRYHLEDSFRISSKNFGKANGIISVPLYSVFCID